MANYSMTISNRVGVLGGNDTSKWGVMVWGVGSWGQSDFTEQVIKNLSSQSLTLDSNFPVDLFKYSLGSVTGSWEVTSVTHTDGRYTYVEPQLESFSESSQASTTWTKVSDESTSWSEA